MLCYPEFLCGASLRRDGLGTGLRVHEAGEGDGRVRASAEGRHGVLRALAGRRGVRMEKRRDVGDVSLRFEAGGQATWRAWAKKGLVPGGSGVMPDRVP